MKMSLMCGAMALLTASLCNAAAANNYEFGFYTDAGGGFCDGVKFTGDEVSGAGYHVYAKSCGYPNARLGGFRSPVRPIGPGQWYTFPVSSTAGDSVSEAVVEVFYINVKDLTWAAYYESTDYGVPFQFNISGVLMRGKPLAMVRPGHKRLGSVIAETLAGLRK